MDGKSRNLTEDYIQQIKALFPEAVTEVADKDGNNISQKVDMEKLALLLGEAAIPTDEIEYRQKYGEKFSFEWAGKRRAIAEAQKRSTGTLRPCPEESVEWDSTENLYIEGDNLEVLKLLQDSYLGAVKMIYIDPPYNTGKDFVYKDNYKDNLANYLEQTNTTNAVNSETSGRYHTNWLNMMYPRLKLARNLLTDDGVIFISIDDNEVSNLKSICDEIFGEDNFLAQLIWERSFAPISLKKHFSECHDYIICYAKQLNQTSCNGLRRTEESNIRYLNPDNDVRGPWQSDNSTVGPAIKEKVYELTLPNGKTILPPNGRCWLYTKERFQEMIADNRIWFGENGSNVPRVKRFLSEVKEGLTPMTLWKYSEVGHSQDASQKLKQLFEDKAYFDYPKPVELIKRCAELYTNKKSIILDFFSGSATTAHAVMQLNTEDQGTRKYICVQLPELTPEDSEARKAGFATIPEIAKERIRRAGKKIVEEQKAKNDGLFAEDAPKLDIGFKVFKLDRSNVKEWDIEFDGATEQQAAAQLRAEFNKTLDILKEERTELDILYEVILKLGLPLTTHVSIKEIDNKKAFVVGYGLMLASFAKGLTYQQIGKMIDLKADFVQPGELKIVLADESFASDNDKTNAMQLFKQRGITNYEII
ncbi:site-specific DNA-methyltransferase [Massilibacteroides vaginae]|uniref:site-specific DNA-methyltransferase n=1 Tax=Massilibacteroides vaginae TaxID=1673718 RepID=UPI000A1C8275|nr:site-specific DNA-methyltransferase [Massilibacteroides vaginae]